MRLKRNIIFLFLSVWKIHFQKPNMVLRKNGFFCFSTTDAIGYDLTINNVYPLSTHNFLRLRDTCWYIRASLDHGRRTDHCRKPKTLLARRFRFTTTNSSFMLNVLFSIY